MVTPLFPFRGPDAPFQCWLFNDQELGQTHERALQIRQRIAVTKYLSSLQMSNDKKAMLLERNRGILGDDLYDYLTARLEGRKVEKYGKCVQFLRSFYR